MTSPAHGAAAVLLHIPSVWAHQERCHNQKARSHRRSTEPQRSLWSRHETLRRLVNLASATGSSSAFCTAGLRLRAFTGTDISKVAQQCYTRVFKQNKCLCSTPLQLCGSLWEGDLPVIEQTWYFMAQGTLSTHTVLGLIFDCANEMLKRRRKEQCRQLWQRAHVQEGASVRASVPQKIQTAGTLALSPTWFLPVT